MGSLEGQLQQAQQQRRAPLASTGEATAKGAQRQRQQQPAPASPGVNRAPLTIKVPTAARRSVAAARIFWTKSALRVTQSSTDLMPTCKASMLTCHASHASQFQTQCMQRDAFPPQFDQVCRLAPETTAQRCHSSPNRPSP